MAEISIEKIVPDDAADLAETMMSAFYADPIWKSQWSPATTLDVIIKDSAARLPWNMIKAGLAVLVTKRMQKAVDTASGKAVGYARWVLPTSCLGETSDEVCWPAALPPRVGESMQEVYRGLYKTGVDADGCIPGLDLQRGDDIDELTVECRERIWREHPDMMELEYFTVHPAYQRRGIGHLLLSEGLAVAGKLGVEILVVAKNPGVKLYAANGFREVDKVILLRPEYGWETPHEITFLVREPARHV